MHDDVATLLRAEPAPPPPPGRWLVEAAPAFEWRPSVLTIGVTLAARDRSTIERHGSVVDVASLAEGMNLLSEAKWDAVLVAPELEVEADGLRFVRAMKLTLVAESLSVRIVSLRARYEKTPFVVAPLPDDSQFAIFRSAREWFLGDVRVTPLGTAVLRSIL